MVLPKSKNSVGLGNSLMNDRFGRGKGSDRKKVSQNGVVRTDHTTGQTYVTNAAKEASWVKMRSVTEQGALDEFLSTAELAGTDFTAEKMNNVKIIHSDQRNPYLLSAAEERGARRKHAQNRGRLTVPRRPKWDETTTPQQLDEQERASLLEWRRGLAELQENDDLLMTPFERNIEVWRQLWRVIERSDLVVQIVDARNPLLFRSEDLEKYVQEVDPKKRNLLLVNKADMMTEEQRRAWAEYFHAQGINYKFFSAHLAKEMNEGRDALEELDARQIQQQIDRNLPEKTMVKNVQDLNLKEEEGEEWTDEEEADEDSESEESQPEVGDVGSQSRGHTSAQPDTQILTVDELESLFLENIPEDATTDRKTTIGLVGYPNVGKSSTINALLGSKKVSVSSTPGKTKHFQTIHLSDRVILCDCPGLVFPNFATTKAELVCSGVLPIDQLREYTGPTGLVAQRIPQTFLENVYGMKINTRPVEEGGTGTPTASEMLRAYARARGFATTGPGSQPDESRAARYILKDYVNGKLLYCHPPPSGDPDTDVEAYGREFNEKLYDFAHLPAKRQAWLIAHSEESGLADGDAEAASTSSSSQQRAPAPVEKGTRAKRLDKGFFGPGSGNAGHLNMPFNHQYTEQGRQQLQQTKQLTGRKAKTMAALEKDVDPAELRMSSSKKHFKGARRKARTVRAGEEDD
ncbi:Large subunit GTPase 1 [Fonsecaea pedrosoi]|nr:Large subunit GTPase 1 [Fonsecaea pedrosoi]